MNLKIFQYITGFLTVAFLYRKFWSHVLTHNEPVSKVALYH